MLANITWGMMGLVVVVTVMLALDQNGRRQLREADRRYQAAVKASKSTVGLEGAAGRIEKRADLTTESGQHGNVPRIAKFEGVHRERGIDSVRAVAPNRPSALGKAGDQHR